jgi:uncharacterized membrane protein YphA (DoxX/SURF4 family)
MGPDFKFHLAAFLIRTITGILFFFQGYDKIFNIKISGVMNTFGNSFAQKKISNTFLRPSILLSAWIELICGLLLAIGLESNIALYLLAFNMIFVALAFSFIKAMWDMQHYFPRLVFIFILLILPSGWDTISLDHILN